MASTTQMIGSRAPAKLGFEFAGLGTHGTANASACLRARLKVWVDGDPVWGGRSNQGFEWSWDVLLEHLANHWTRLLTEETYPGGIEVQLPSQIWKELDRLDADEMPEKVRLDLEDRIYEFEAAHNLAAGIEGAELAPLRIMREGNLFIIDASDTEPKNSIVLPQTEVRDILENLGELLSDFLSDANDERSKYLRRLWKDRDGDTRQRLVYLYGEDAKRAQELENIVAAANDNRIGMDDLRIAARMLSQRVGDTVIASLLNIMAGLPPSGPVSNYLATLSDKAMQELRRYSRRRPYFQGQEVAKSLRRELDLAASATIGNIDSLVVDRLGVHLSEQEFGLGSEQIDAIGIWASAKQPHILVNKRGMHSADEFTRRATIAHELCHILVDRDRALPALEVLGGRVPIGPEQRAGAFAAEFLCPMSQAYEFAKKAATADEAVRELAKSFVVSYHLAANQVKNAIFSEAWKRNCAREDVFDSVFFARVTRLASGNAPVSRD